MPLRPGLDDDPHLAAVVSVWREGSAEIDRRLAAVQQRIMAELANPTAPYVARRLEAQADRLRDLRDQAAFILDDSLQQTEQWAGSERFASLYAAGARVADARFSFTAPHRAAVEALARDTYNDVLTATAYVDESAKAFVRRVSRQIVTAKLTAGDAAAGAARQLRRDLEREFRSRGIGAITYRDGSRHSFGEYAEMLIRTKTGLAYNAGTLNTTRQAGIQIVEILDGANCGLTAHHDPDLANGLIVTMDTAGRYPLAHPNCRRAFAPRPDLSAKDLSKPGEGPSPRSVTTAAQRADQAAFEQDLARRRAAAAAGRRGGRRRRRSRRERRGRETAERGRSGRLSVREQARAENARRRRQIERARLQAQESSGRAFLNERANKVGGGRPSSGAAARWGVSDDQLRQGRVVAKQVKADIRKVAAQEADVLGGWLGENDLDVLARPERLARRTEIGGRTRRVRTQSGYDWLEQLDDATAARVRKRMVDDAAYSPDVLAEQVRRKVGLDLSDDEAMDWLVDRWLHEDALRSVASGRVPKYADPANLLPGDFEAEGYRLDRLFGVDVDDAAGHVAQVQAEAAGQYARRILRPSKLGPDPWQMDPGDFVRELEAIEDAARAVGTEGATPGPGFQRGLDRLRELVPVDLDGVDGMNPWELHERLRLTAQTAGYFDDLS